MTDLRVLITRLTNTPDIRIFSERVIFGYRCRLYLFGASHRSYCLYFMDVRSDGSTRWRYNILFAGERVVIEVTRQHDEKKEYRLVRGDDHALDLASLL